MLFPLKKICQAKNVRRDGSSVIYIQYCFSSSRRTMLGTGIDISYSYWDDKNQKVKDSLPEEYGNAAQYNYALKRMFRCAEDLVECAIKRKMADPRAFVKNTFTPEFDSIKLIDIAKEMDSGNEKINMNVFYQIDEYVKSKMWKVTPKMDGIYRNMRARLKAFEVYRQKEITVDSIDYSFYEEFVEFLMYEYVQRRFQGKKGLKVNTIGCTVKQFRIFLKNRMLKKIIPIIDIEGWTIMEEEADAVYISWEEIWKIHNVDLSESPHLEDYRNDVVLGCLTGLRFSDFSQLAESDVRGDLLYKKQQKSNHWVVIPLRPEAKKILENRFRKGVKPQTNPEFNRHVKTIVKLAGITQPITHSYKKGNQRIVETKPKYEWITSHTCRRSFCTNEFLAGTPAELIMKISGHKSLKDFYRYIRVAPEEAAGKIRDIWERREKEFAVQLSEKITD